MEKIVKILKKIKIKNIIILILLLIFNAYAWFIYATRASSSLDVHISSWNVEFSVGEEESTTEILIEVERVYPGMETFEKNIVFWYRGRHFSDAGCRYYGISPASCFERIGSSLYTRGYG